MIAVLTLLLVLVISLIITRVATISLTHTGLSRESARFQARSAFTGVGFTSRESEQVINHPVRRRIIMGLMLLGNAGIITVISSVILTVVAQQQRYPLWMKFSILAGGVLLIWLVARSRWVDNRLSRVIDWALVRYAHIDTRDYTSILHLAGGYMVSEILVEPGDWLAYKRLEEARLSDEGVLVLGIKRENGSYLGAPRGNTQVMAGDRILVYGRTTDLRELESRKKGIDGDREHQESVTEHQDQAEKGKK